MDANELIAEVLAESGNDLQTALYALEDDEYLAGLGITDPDQLAVEDAWHEIKQRIEWSK